LRLQKTHLGPPPQSTPSGLPAWAIAHIGIGGGIAGSLAVAGAFFGWRWYKKRTANKKGNPS